MLTTSPLYAKISMSDPHDWRSIAGTQKVYALMYDYDVLIIGCGISGAAAAYMLARYDLKTGILERSNDVANGTTKANSAILHAGYDPAPGSLMARLNRRGISMARDICRRLDIEYRPMPSLVIAFNERDMQEVHRLYERGIANGVSVRILSRE